MQNVKQNLKEREHLEHLVVDGRILLNKHGVSVDWINLAEDRAQWRALVKMVMHFELPYKTGKE
jgi:hypothetical protein